MCQSSIKWSRPEFIFEPHRIAQRPFSGLFWPLRLDATQRSTPGQVSRWRLPILSFSPSTCRHSSTTWHLLTPASQGCPDVSRFHRALGCSLFFVWKTRRPEGTPGCRLHDRSHRSTSNSFKDQPRTLQVLDSTRRAKRRPLTLSPSPRGQPDARPFPRFGPFRVRQPYN